MLSIRERNGQFTVMWRDKDGRQHIRGRPTGSPLEPQVSRSRGVAGGPGLTSCLSPNGSSVMTSDARDSCGTPSVRGNRFT